VRKTGQHRAVFSGYLGAQNLKMTRERQTILDGIDSLRGHFTADDLHLAIVRRKALVSRATVYRTLEHLVASGIVQKVYVSDHDRGKALYERAHGRAHHEHMNCVRCGRIVEFSDEALEKRQEHVCRRLGFKPMRHSLRIEGICRGCREER